MLQGLDVSMDLDDDLVGDVDSDFSEDDENQVGQEDLSVSKSCPD